MRLSEIRALIGNIADYKPENESYSDELDRLINDAYYELYASHPWPWAQKEINITAYADVTGEVALGATPNHIIPTGAPWFETWFEGMPFELDNVAGTDLEGDEYEAGRVATTSSLYATDVNLTVGETYDMRVKHRYIDLDWDNVSILQVGVRNKLHSGSVAQTEPGRFVPITRFEGEWWNLNLAEVGTATSWVVADGYHTGSPVLAPTVSTHAGDVWPDGDYEVATTRSYAGRHSALSPVSKVTIDNSGGNQALQVSLPDIFSSQLYTRHIWLKAPNYKTFRLLETGIDENSHSFLYSAAQAPDADWQFVERAPEHDGYNQRIRLHPRQAADTELTIRYMFRPRLLIEDTDTPEFPASHHKYLAHKVLTDLFVKLDNLTQSEIYRRKAEAELIRMEQRYLSEVPRRWVKQGFDVPVMERKYGPLIHNP